jgi:hypothetical protein
MSSTLSMSFAKSEPFSTAGDERLADFRQRRALEERERADLKAAEQAEQRSELNSADLRIRAWEKVHQLRMPSDPRHPALSAIAVATQLTLADVQNEQRRRAAGRASAAVSSVREPGAA